MNYVDLTADDDDDVSPSKREARKSLAAEHAQEELSSTWQARKRPTIAEIKIEKGLDATTTDPQNAPDSISHQEPDSASILGHKRKRFSERLLQQSDPGFPTPAARGFNIFLQQSQRLPSLGRSTSKDSLQTSDRNDKASPKSISSDSTHGPEMENQTHATPLTPVEINDLRTRLQSLLDHRPSHNKRKRATQKRAIKRIQSQLQSHPLASTPPTCFKDLLKSLSSPQTSQSMTQHTQLSVPSHSSSRSNLKRSRSSPLIIPKTNDVMPPPPSPTKRQKVDVHWISSASSTSKSSAISQARTSPEEVSKNTHASAFTSPARPPPVAVPRETHTSAPTSQARSHRSSSQYPPHPSAPFRTIPASNRHSPISLIPVQKPSSTSSPTISQPQIRATSDVPDKKTPKTRAFDQQTKFLAGRLAATNPGSGPYSPEEDALLLHLVEKIEPGQFGWVDIHQQYFPHRTTRETIYCRWHKKLQHRSKPMPLTPSAVLAKQHKPLPVGVSGPSLQPNTSTALGSGRLSQLIKPQPVKLHPRHQHASSTLKTTDNPVRRFRADFVHERAIGTASRRSCALSLGPHLSFTGTSGDVNTVAWSPNGRYFAAGSAALTDSHSMQYNLPNNLLLGDIDTGTLRELPDHVVERERPTTGANASNEMFNSQDPFLFTTISNVQFSPDGQIMFSAGYDRVARIWDIRKGISKADYIRGWNHKASIDLLAVNDNGLFATGTRRSNGSCIKVMRYGFNFTTNELKPILSLSSHGSHLVPSSMKWGPTIHGLEKYLLIGFSADGSDFGAGEVYLWDVETKQEVIPLAKSSPPYFTSRNVFDVAWSPSIFGRFAVACTAGASVNRGTNSVVRIHDSRLSGDRLNVNNRCTIELECPARDINDAIFNPVDDNIISTGCTDGISYVWDLRNPDEILHQFKHDVPLIALDENQMREQVDTGIRFMSWGLYARQLYTGSSDGIVSLWNPYVAPENAHVKEVTRLRSGVMSGAFSPDFSDLLLGEVNGTISVLSVGSEESQGFQLQRASTRGPPGKKAAIAESGREVAKELVRTKQIEIQPFGDLPIRQAVQGRNYDYSGYLDKGSDAPELRKAAAEMQARFRPESPCKLDHGFPLLTEEQQGDDGVWRTRFPESVRYTSSSDMPRECFRCQKLMINVEVDTLVEEVKCPSCGHAWRVDILGFTSKERHLDGFWTSPLDANSTIESHYNSLWQDRPASPL